LRLSFFATVLWLLGGCAAVTTSQSEAESQALAGCGPVETLEHIRQEIEAVELGALAQIRVEGEWDDDLMTQVQKPSPIEP